MDKSCIQTKNIVDFIVARGKQIEIVKPQFSDIESGVNYFNFNQPKPLALTLYGYGVAGKRQYKLNKLLNPIDDSKRAIIIVNTHKDMCGVIVEFGESAQKVLGITQYVVLEQVKTQYNNRDSLERGLDPQAANWVVYFDTSATDNDLNDLEPATVHVFALITNAQI